MALNCGWIRPLVLLLIGLIISCSNAIAQTRLQLLDEDTGYTATAQVNVLTETDAPLTIEQAVSIQGAFLPWSDKHVNFAPPGTALWLHVTLDNISNTPDWVVCVDSSQNDIVEFYLVDGESVIQTSQQGKLRGRQSHRRPSFPVTLPVNKPLSLYIRVASDSSPIIAPLTVQSQSKHLFTTQLDNLASGVFYGGLVILVLYNLLLFITAKEVSLIAFVGFTIGVTVWQLMWSGHLQFLFNSTVTMWLSVHIEFIILAIGISSGLFVLTCIETKHFAKCTHKALVTLIVIQGLVAAMLAFDILPTGDYQNLIISLGAVASICYVATSIEALLEGFRPARYLIIAWLILAAGATAGLLTQFGFIQHNTLYQYAFQFGLFVQASLFSVAIIEKSRGKLNNEVKQATNDLRNNMLLIEEQNVRLDISRKEAVKNSNVKSQFLANMSHEIRTPLNAILGFSRELEAAQLAPEQAEQVRIVNSAAGSLLTVVNDVLDFSKIEAGKFQISNQAFSPLTLFEDMMAIMANPAHIKGLDLVFEYHSLPEKLIGDAARLRQVLTNLIGNAIKFTSHGYISLSVRAQTGVHGVIDLVFDITDTGIGINRQDRQKLFSAFSQVDDALNRSYQGTGLGLVISKELVRLMNGRISLRSDPGLGSTFSVLVRTTQFSKRMNSQVRKPWEGKQVVVFDPFPESRRATLKMLHAAGAKTYAIDSLSHLKQFTQAVDYLMVFLPHHSRYSAYDILDSTTRINTKRKVVWYANSRSIASLDRKLSAFSTKIRLPVTLTRLNNILKMEEPNAALPANQIRQQFPLANVLAVDDMSLNLMLLDTWFKDSHVTLTKALSGSEAVELCERHAYDIILMDVQMPGMDGLTASKKIRKTALNIGTPIVALTAHAFKEEQEGLLSSGMDDYLPKPVAYEELVNVMRRWCECNDQQTLNNDSVFDVRLANRRTNNNSAASKAMLSEFLIVLPEAARNIASLFEQHSNEDLLQEVHRLHGASCYTGAPEIQSLCNDIETHLKQDNHAEVSKLVPLLLDAIERFRKVANTTVETMT